MCRLICWVFAIFYLAFAGTVFGREANDVPVHVRFGIGQWSEQLSAYQKDFVTELMALSYEEYGDYRLEFVDLAMSEARLQQVLESGRVHMNLSSGTCPAGTSEFAINKYTYPILNHLLGLRELIVRKSDVAKFEALDSLSQLKRFRPAQKDDWPDSAVYLAAGFDLVPALSYTNLVPMLLKARYDFLPLSTLEVRQAIAARPESAEQLAVVPNVYIYYPILVMLCVSDTSPGIDERVRSTLDLMFSDGYRQSYMALLDKHFDVPKFGEASTVFILNNPNLDKGLNEKIIGSFKKNYLSDFPGVLKQ